MRNKLCQLIELMTFLYDTIDKSQETQTPIGIYHTKHLTPRNNYK